MKKEIKALIKAENGTFRLNNIASLKRWTVDGLGDKVDMLVIEFDNINHVNFSPNWYTIEARDYEGIIAECTAAIERYLAWVTDRLTKDLKAGYRNATNI